MKKTKKNKPKKFKVNIGMSWSKDLVVSAENQTEAKKIAFEKFKDKIQRKDFEFLVEAENPQF